MGIRNRSTYGTIKRKRRGTNKNQKKLVIFRIRICWKIREIEILIRHSRGIFCYNILKA